MKAKPTTVPIIPSIKDTWEVSQDGAGCMEDSQTSEWLCLAPSNVPLCAHHSLGAHSVRATNAGGTPVLLKLTSWSLLSTREAGAGAPLMCRGLPLGALDHKWFERHWLPALVLGGVDTLAR